MKRQKLSSSSSDEEQGSDRISHLPEPIRIHILSLLPIEDAFRSSILSKQWRNICNSLPNLKLDQLDYEKKTHTRDFTSFVNQVLLLRSELDIENFNLVSRVDANASSIDNISTWISFVVRRNVQELRLQFTPKLQQKLPPCIYSCRTLRTLDLSNLTLKLPSVVELPALKTLKFFFVAFQSKNPPDQFLSFCPVLEKFSMLACSWDDNAVINISSPTIETLILSVLLPSKAIKICAPNLRAIKYIGNPPDISSETLSSLYDVDLGISPSFNDNDKITNVLAQNMNKIIRGLRSAHKLRLYFLYVEYLARVRDLFSSPPASCASMKHLKLDMYCTENHARVVIFMINSYPNLETLSIILQKDCPASSVFNMELPLQSQQLSTKGMLKHLKTVAICSFGGSESELELVEFLLGNATVMEKMMISYSKEMKEDLPSRTNISDKLSNLTKASPSAVISFS